MSDVQRQIDEYLENNGFKLLRRNKHLIWSDGINQITTAMSASDYRAFYNIRATVRRLQKKSLEEAQETA